MVFSIPDMSYNIWTFVISALSKTKVCKASHLADVSQEVSILLRARRAKTMGADELSAEIGSRRLPAEKAKKLARIERIRQLEGVPDSAPVLVSVVLLVKWLISVQCFLI